MGELWRRTLGKDTAYPHLIADGVAVVQRIDRGRTLFGLDAATGAERWRVEIEGNIAVDHADGVLVIGDAAKRVMAIDLQTGREHWTASTGASWAERIHAADGLVAWVTTEGAVVASLADGAERRRSGFPAVDGFFVDSGGNVSVGDDVVVYSGRYYDRPYYDREPMPASLHRCVAVDIATGAVLWTRETPLLAPGVFSTRDGTEAVDPRSGEARWRAPVWPGFPYEALVLAGSVIVCNEDGLAALDAATGELRWRIDDKPPVHYWEAQAAGDEHVLFALVNGHRRDVRVVNAATGAVCDRVPVPRMSSFAGDGSRLVVTVERMTVAAYQTMKC